jgi:hypothetical protein
MKRKYIVITSNNRVMKKFDLLQDIVNNIVQRMQNDINLDIWRALVLK